MIALRAPFCLPLAIATGLTAAATVALLARPAPPGPSAPELPAATPPEQLPPEQVEAHSQSDAPACDPDSITAIVIRGQFTAHQPQSFAISFGSAHGQYTAMTDPRGYFEVRIPREDFDGDFCQLPLTSKDFSDDQMTLKYRIDIER